MASGDLRCWIDRMSGFEGALSVIGTGKNAGKTTVLNFLLRSLPAKDLAVTSIGRDGEALDVIERLPKPGILVKPGTVFATAEGCLARCGGRWQILRRTSFATPLGPVAVCRSETTARVELAGPVRNADLRSLHDRLTHIGVRRTLVDGAFDRSAASASSVCVGVIGAAGSAGRLDVPSAAGSAAALLRRFRIPRWEELEGVRSPASHSEIGNPGRTDADRNVRAPSEGVRAGNSKAGAPGQLEDVPASHGSFIRMKALTDGDIEGMAGQTVVLPDPSCCLISDDAWARLDSSRVCLRVGTPVPLLGLFVSPFRPHLPPLAARDLLAAVLRFGDNVPVFDLGLEGELGPC